MSEPLVDGLARPCLRPLEAIPFQQEGQQHVAWRDPLGLAPLIEVPAAVAVLMSLLDGQRDQAEVRRVWREMAGEDLPSEFVARFVSELDEHGLLDTPRFRDRRASALREFRAAGRRPPAHCPAGYPAEPEALRARLDELLARGRAVTGGWTGGPPAGLIAPHIDLHRGGTCYGAAYEALAASDAELFVILGIAHSTSCWPAEPPLQSLTRLTYETPLGPLPTDLAFVDELVDRYVAAGGDAEELFRDELVHREEHSLEFQTLFVQHLHGGRGVRAVPLLLGSFHEFYACPDRLTGDTGPGRLTAALAATIAACPDRVCIIAGADLAHVGPRFGDREPVDQARVEQVAAADTAALAALAESASAWFADFAVDGNPRNVCSVSNLYLLRALLPTAEFRPLHYEVAYDPEQTVSFAAAALI